MTFRTGSLSWMHAALLPIATLTLLTACGSDAGGGKRFAGQSDFTSRAPQGNSSRGGLAMDGAASGGSTSAAPVANGSGTTARTVEETDLYRLEGNRLYYLNGYRGLMVFDVTDVDHPKLLGRSPIFGSPVEMLVRNGVATVVVADWYGQMDDGTPFYGSIVRGLDATDPANIKPLGEARLGGWVRDTRVVGDVLYAVTEDYQWYYGWADGMSSGVSVGGYANGAKTIVSSVNFAGGKVVAKDSFDVPGYGGIFNVTPDSILFAHDDIPANQDPNTYVEPTSTVLDYIDISDPAGAITPRGSIVIAGRVQGWGADNGRWNLDFADGVTAHAFGCASQSCWSTDSTYAVSTVDFSNPDAPVLASQLPVPSNGWSPTARFDGTRMYVAPNNDSYYSGVASSTPVQIYDLSNPAAPVLAGQTSIPGSVWLFMPNGDRVFALGDDAQVNANGYYGSQVSLSYIDVTDPALPTVIGTSKFGDGWAWTPAAGTFKAFTKDDTKGLVVLPFSGWVPNAYDYFNGLQLIEYTPSSITTAGAALTKGWVERGIFVGSRLVSLSDLALSVVDYTDHMSPKVVTELTLARNVVDAKPNGATIAELSTDWWGNDLDHSVLNVLPIAQAEETTSGAEIASAQIEGTGAQVFHNGQLSYVVSTVRSPADCNSAEVKNGGMAPGSDGVNKCYLFKQQVQVVDRSNNGARLRGKVLLPYGGYSYWGYGLDYGWWGWWWGGWYYGADVVQVHGDKLAFRRWNPVYNSAGYVDSYQSLQVVDLSDADAPSVASTVITRDPDSWWGNMRTVGDTLYTSHYEWVSKPAPNGTDYGYVRYYLDRIDLTDAAHPYVSAKINVPGFLVGASAVNPSIIYTVDYGWNTNWQYNEFNILQIDGDRAYLQASNNLGGWIGDSFVRGSTVYMSRQRYLHPNTNDYSTVTELMQIDTSEPNSPVISSSTAKAGWGWLLDVEGDRAIVQSGWGSGVDLYRLSSDAPQFDRTVRTLGWGSNSVSRQNNSLFISSGYWGVQRVDL